MKTLRSLLLCSACWLLAWTSLTSSQAASLLLDFGPTTVQTADALRNPGHVLGAVPNAEITWNRIAGDTNTLYYGDGTPAAGVTLNLGRSSATGPVGNDIIDFDDDGYNPGLTGTTLTTGIYAGTSPVRDGIFGGNGGTNNLAMGLRLDGLPAGTYRVVVHGRNSNTTGPAGLLFYGINGASAGTYVFSTNDVTAVLANTSPPITNGFVEGDNCAVLVVTLGAGQSLYLACEGTVAAEMRGFFNAIAIVPGTPDLPARITGHPFPPNRAVLETATTTFIAGGWGTAPLFKQWRFNGTNVLTDGPNISGANGSTLTLRNVTPAMAGDYSLFVSNALGSELSSNGVLTVTPGLNTEQMTNIWNLQPGDRPYVSTANTERGIAFNSRTTNVLLVSRTPSLQVVALDAQTGAEKHFLDVSGVVDGTSGIILNAIGVADDGVVYAANLTTTATSPPYKVYRWDNDTAGTPPFPVFIGDPAGAVQPNRRWGDNLAVRGAGADTQILIGPGTAGTNVVLLRTISGNDFQTEIPPAVIAVSGVPSSFGAITLSLAFGPGTNTFWAKTLNGPLYLIEFDLASQTASVLRSYATSLVPGALRTIAVGQNQRFLAGIAAEAPNNNARLYDISDLAIGPLLRDQEAFTPQNANGNGTGASALGANYLFALDSNNGIKAFALNTNYVPPAVSFASQPADQTVMEGVTVVFSAVAASPQPLVYQWRFNGTSLSDGGNISGAHTNPLTLANVTASMAGTYSLFVSNVFGTATSSNAVLTVLPTFNTAQMSNLWNLLPGERPYLGTGSTERGLAYNPATTNLLLVSRLSADPTVVVLDARTGAEKHSLDTTGIPTSEAGLSFGLNTIGVADDGVVFGVGVTIHATSPPLEIYRWPDDSPGNPPVKVFSGDPAVSVQPNLGYTDAIAVRGAGADTQILVAPRGGTNVILLRSISGLDFQTEIPPAVIPVSGVPSGFAQVGIAFGPGTNTLWGKTVNQQLYLVQFDLASNTGAVLYAYSTNLVPANFRAVAADKNQKFLAGITTDLSPNVRLYDVSDLVSGPALRDQEVFATQHPNTTVGGTGATAFGNGYLFALDSNNGIKAFQIDASYVPPPASFSITSVRHSGGAIVFSWPTAAGRNYQVQFKDAVAGASWSNIGNTITAASGTASFTNAMAEAATRFFRVQSQ